MSKNKNSKLKILVTGANGFIGSNMCKYLLDKNVIPYAMIRRSSDLSVLQELIPNWKKMHFVYADLRNYDSLVPIIKDMDIIYHIAGVIKGNSPWEFEEGNFIGTQNLIRACKNHCSHLKRIVVVSSMVAGGPGTPNNPQQEDSNRFPLKGDWYGISKYKTEKICKQSWKLLPIVIIRPPTVIGPGDKISLDLFQVAKMGLKVFVFGKPRFFSIVHVEDLIHGIELCGYNPDAVGQIFLFGCDQNLPYRDIHEVIASKVFKRPYGSLIPISIPFPIFYFIGILLESIGRLFNKPSFINRSKVIQAAAPGQTMSNQKAKRILGWKPNNSISSAIYQSGIWYKEHGWL
ncbi:MAG: NAD(P)-dependent oxidoreductase [Candidatus Lokiarchaeota archaeon]|nr:NAD(P)-dependent oxidoreductase [Candidatus Harpocratesius repetitus]